MNIAGEVLAIAGEYLMKGNAKRSLPHTFFVVDEVKVVSQFEVFHEDDGRVLVWAKTVPKGAVLKACVVIDQDSVSAVKGVETVEYAEMSKRPALHGRVDATGVGWLKEVCFFFDNTPNEQAANEANDDEPAAKKQKVEK